jgi:hypothetical protein
MLVRHYVEVVDLVVASDQDGEVRAKHAGYFRPKPGKKGKFVFTASPGPSVFAEFRTRDLLDYLQLLLVCSSTMEMGAVTTSTTLDDTAGVLDNPAQGRADFQRGWSVMGLNRWQQAHDQGHDRALSREILSISLFP